MYRIHILAALILLAGALPRPAPAQTIRHDLVEPTLAAAVSLDATTGEFIYDYSVANGTDAEQRIATVLLELPIAVSGAAAPADWEVAYAPPPNDIQWYAAGAVDPAWVPAHDGDIPGFLSEIEPGGSLAGFLFRHTCAVSGSATYYVRGHNQVPEMELGGTAPDIPHWRDDSVTGTILAPGDCSIVRDWGNRRPAVDGFVGLVNFADGDALPAGPLTVQLRFSRGGETVDGTTLQVALNQVDVTAAFVENPAGDMVAVFQPGSPPLTAGRNVLLVSVDGVVPGTSRTATDADRFTFTIP